MKSGGGVIKQLVREIFSFSTKIKGVACSKPDSTRDIPKVEMPNEKNFEQTPDAAEAQTPQPHRVEPSMNEPQSSTMIEDAEMGGSASCVTNCGNEQTPVEEQNGTDITQEPMVLKAIEMFEAKKVIVQSKI